MRPTLFCLALLGWLPSLAAQEPKPEPPKDKKYAVTEAAEAGPDFLLQGEYNGSVQTPAWGFGQTGLQVVALGNGRFDALLYRGGLPGAGWNRSDKLKLNGNAAGSGAVVLGNGQSITLYNTQATVYDPSGRCLGSLPRVERRSPTIGLAAPPGATILFNGRPPEHLTGAKLTPDGLLKVGVLTKMPVGDFRLHLEFRSPFMPFARGQDRGNSGVYIQQRYEVQILDSFGLEGIENECGGLYRQTKPDVNMALPPLAWQTYDIWFTAAKFGEDGKTRTAPARITVLHNGVAIHSNREIANKTGGGKQEGPEPFPINLQDHGNPVNFRNIWIVLGTGSPPVATEAAPVVCCTPCVTEFVCPPRRGFRRR